MSDHRDLFNLFGPIFGFAGFGLSGECLDLTDVDQRLEQILRYFDGNVARFYIQLGRYLAQKEAKKIANRPIVSEEKEQKETSEQKKKRDEEAVAMELESMHKLRRKAQMVNINKKMKSEEGRRLSQVEKNAYVMEAAVELAKTEEEETKNLGLDEIFGSDDDEEKWKFLPYQPLAGDDVDEALAEQLNVWEIDINIKKLKSKKKGKKKKKKKGPVKTEKKMYKVQKKIFQLKLIHGVLLCKEQIRGKGKKNQKDPDWVECVPTLRKMAGMKSQYSEEQQKEIEKIKQRSTKV